VSEVLRLREGVEWRLVDGEVLALDTASSTFLNANRTGAVLWSALAAGGTRAELVARLVHAFDVDEEVAGRDVDDFLGALAVQGLLAGAE
jgi:hypothetical protein